MINTYSHSFSSKYKNKINLNKKIDIASMFNQTIKSSFVYMVYFFFKIPRLPHSIEHKKIINNCAGIQCGGPLDLDV